MDNQESGIIEPIMLEEYLDNLKPGEKVIICKMQNGNLNVVEYDDFLDRVEKYINKLFEFNSYDECGEFDDNKFNWNKIEEDLKW